MITYIGTENFEGELIEFLDKKLRGDFKICCEKSIDANNSNFIYSPFVLGLIGTILFGLKKNKIVELMLKRISKKLLSTKNRCGLYNFYGDDEYYYDLDTTSVVNTFLFSYCNELPYRINILNTIRKNQNLKDGSIFTWINRERNYIDWFVNFNIYIFFRVINFSDEALNIYLRNNMDSFIDYGSRYYSDITFPMFFSYFCYNQSLISKKEFLKPTYSNLKNMVAGENTISLFFSHLSQYNQKKNEFLSKLLQENWTVDISYFNSSKAIYLTKELNAAITLYLLKRLEV